MIALVVLTSWAHAQPSGDLVPPITEIRHPRYEDANGVPVPWKSVRELARRTDAARRVRARRAGRTVLRLAFAGATVAELYGVNRLANERNIWALPLGIQAASTATIGVLLWTSTPRYVREDRALLLSGANAVLVPR